MNYLYDLDLDDKDIEELKKLSKNIVESLETFPLIIKTNFNILKDLGINNYKDIFLKHTHMFLQNPNRFQAIFDKYEHNDLVRCLEKNGAIIERL